MRLGLVSTKGGVGKSTSAVYLALGLHRTGRTMAVDCDPEGSLLNWREQAGDAWPLALSVISLPTRTVHRTLLDVSADYDHVVLDGPPGDHGIIRAVVMAADIVIVPVSPTGLDLNRLRPTFEILAEMEASHPVDAGIVLTRVRAGTRSRTEAREALAAEGYPVLDTEIGLSEAIAGSYGTVPGDLGRYEDLLAEVKR